MHGSRCYLRALALVILTKSFYCAAVESQFDLRDSQRGAAELCCSPAEDRDRPLPVPPLPTSEDCADTGCLCQGFVHPPVIAIPQPEMSADQSMAQPAVGSNGIGLAGVVRINWLWHLDDFPDQHRSGRTHRLWIGSLTI